MSGPTVWSTVLHIVRKDLTVEQRSREVVYTTLFFAVSCLLIFSFAVVQEGRTPAGAGEGILWATMTLAGTLALGRTFERERQAETLRALLLSPAPRAAIYVGKLLGIVLTLAAVELVVVPLVVLFFGTPVFRRPGWTLAILVAGIVGFSAVGTLFAAMLVRARSRDVLLPVVLYPTIVPVLIAGVRGTSTATSLVFDDAVAGFWLALLVAFDVVFLTLALWTFEPLMAD
jgi:heme exporter protein CcmB